MRRSNFLSIAAAASFLVSSCVDSKYDLSDIDDTSRIDVNNLTIPVNIDPIYLKSVISIDDTDPSNHIKIVNGAYAYVQSGDFKSMSISVPAVTIESAVKSSVDISLPLTLPQLPDGVSLPKELTVNLPKNMTDYHLVATNISDDICDLSSMACSGDITIDVTVGGLESVDATYTLSDFKLQLPAGMHVSGLNDFEYDATTNIATLGFSSKSPKHSIKCNATGITLPQNAFDESTHRLDCSGEVGILGGGLGVAISGTISSLPENLSLKVDFAFDNIKVLSIDGVVKHNITDLSVPEINITDLPDVLAQSGTNLILSNPCLYLSVNNPLYEVGLYAQTGFDITAFHGTQSSVYLIDNAYFTIPAAATDNFCFSPKMPQSVDADYVGCQHVPFTSLSNILSGDGIPDKLKVDLTNPSIPRQTIMGFRLGYDYGDIKGTYKFVAPLQFKDGTVIYYAHKVTGWNDDDIDKLTISRLDVELNVSTDIPASVKLTGYPIDKHGNRINNVSINGADIDALASNQHVKISISGEVTHLDGIEFVAKAEAVDGGKALSPDMTVSLSSIRACVSGYYLGDF